jgi:hypothetical protein
MSITTMSYKKIAFFVEGYTEQQFIKKLLVEIFGQKKIAIEIKQIRGGKKVATSYTTIETPTHPGELVKYYVLIYDCNGDGAIKSYILENRQSLIDAGYSKVIGVRDIYPDYLRSEIFQLQNGLNYKLPQKDLPIVFVLSIMEVESWFLAEENHYEKIDSKLTLDHINENFSFNPKDDDTQLIDKAAIFLKDIYSSAGLTYKKEKIYIDRTINALDYSNIYFAVKERNSSLNILISEFEEVFY